MRGNAPSRYTRASTTTHPSRENRKLLPPSWRVGLVQQMPPPALFTGISEFLWSLSGIHLNWEVYRFHKAFFSLNIDSLCRNYHFSLVALFLKKKNLRAEFLNGLHFIIRLSFSLSRPRCLKVCVRALISLTASERYSTGLITAVCGKFYI